MEKKSRPHVHLLRRYLRRHYIIIPRYDEQNLRTIGSYIEVIPRTSKIVRQQSQTIQNVRYLKLCRPLLSVGRTFSFFPSENCVLGKMGKSWLCLLGSQNHQEEDSRDTTTFVKPLCCRGQFLFVFSLRPAKKMPRKRIVVGRTECRRANVEKNGN